MKTTAIGIDSPKQSYSVHGVDARGKVLLRDTASRPGWWSEWLGSSRARC